MPTLTYKPGTGYWSNTGWVEGGNSANDISYKTLTDQGLTSANNFVAPAIVSSSSYTDSRNQQSGMVAAGTPQPTITTSPQTTAADIMLQNALTGSADFTKKIESSGQNLQAAAQLSFDAQLASQNNLYNSAIQQIRQQAEGARQVAVSNAVALNPYSQSKGAQTSANFQNAINAKYQALETDIRNKAVAAEQLARAGYAKESAQITSDINSSIATVRSQINSALQSWASLNQNQSQFNAQENRAEYQFGVTQTNVASDNFRGLLQQDLPGVEEINSMIKSGAILKSPIYQEALKAGYSPEGATSLLLSAAQAQEDKTGLDWAKFQLQMQAEERRANTLNKTAMTGNSIAAVSNARSVLGTRGVQYGSSEYALGEVAASSQGIAPDAATRTAYLQTNTAIGALSNVSSGVDELMKNQGGTDAVANRFNAYIKNPTAENTMIIKGMVQPLYTLIGKGIFGQTGNMSDVDVQLVAAGFESYANTYDVNTALRKAMVDVLKSKVNAQVSLDAGSGINLTGLQPTIQNIYSVIDGINVSGTPSKKTTTSSSTGFTWQGTPSKKTTTSSSTGFTWQGTPIKLPY